MQQPVDMIQNDAGVYVPADQALPGRQVPDLPPIILEQGEPVVLKSWKPGELIPLKGWVYEVVEVNPWGIQLFLRCPTPKRAKELGLVGKKARSKKASLEGPTS